MAYLALDCTGETFSCGLLTRKGVFTEVTGLNPRREQMILTLALALAVAVAIKVVGALLIGALLIWDSEPVYL